MSRPLHGDAHEGSARALIRAISHASRPLLIVDFDGTLSDRVDDPDRARPVPGAIEALEGLTQRGVAVAVLSGRGRGDLLTRTGKLAGVDALGSFGAEGSDQALELSAEQRALRERARRVLASVLSDFAPGWMEAKPLGAAAHLRGLRPENRAQAHAAIAASIREHPGLFIRHVAHTAEVSILPISKAVGMRALQQRYQPDVCVLAGDDHSDEEAAQVLRSGDWFVVVGDLVRAPPTCMSLYCERPSDLVALLRAIRD